MYSEDPILESAARFILEANKEPAQHMQGKNPQHDRKSLHEKLGCKQALKNPSHKNHKRCMALSGKTQDESMNDTKETIKEMLELGFSKEEIKDLLRR